MSKNTRLTVKDGDFKGVQAKLFRTFWKRRFKKIKIGKGWFRSETFRKPDIAAIDILDNGVNQMSSAIKGGAAGMLVAGPVGAAIGSLITSTRASKVYIRLTLRDGRMTVLKGTTKDFDSLAFG